MTQSPLRLWRGALAAHPVTSAAIAILVAVDIFLVLWVPLYSRLTPKWGDFPFFYWYLLIIMPVTSLLLSVAAMLQKRITRPAGPLPADDVPVSTAGSEDVQ
jgi:hypothetical protein